MGEGERPLSCRSLRTLTSEGGYDCDAPPAKSERCVKTLFSELRTADDFEAEIDPEVDFDSRRAVYFRQMRYGLFVSDI